jgi:cytochrome c553
MKTINLIRIIFSVACVAILLTSAHASDDLKNGKYLFQNCMACHGMKGEGNQLSKAPAIAGMPQWYVLAQLKNFKAGIRGGHPDDVDGMRMRPMMMTLRTPQDIRDVAAYVSSLPKAHVEPTLEGGDAEKGKMTYLNCMGCHGMSGEGVYTEGGIMAPPLTISNDWYYETSFLKFVKKIRGGDPRDTNGMTMSGFVSNPGLNFDQQTIKDVMAYLHTLKKEAEKPAETAEAKPAESKDAHE